MAHLKKSIATSGSPVLVSPSSCDDVVVGLAARASRRSGACDRRCMLSNCTTTFTSSVEPTRFISARSLSPNDSRSLSPAIHTITVHFFAAVGRPDGGRTRRRRAIARAAPAGATRAAATDADAGAVERPECASSK